MYCKVQIIHLLLPNWYTVLMIKTSDKKSLCVGRVPPSTWHVIAKILLKPQKIFSSEIQSHRCKFDLAQASNASKKQLNQSFSKVGARCESIWPQSNSQSKVIKTLRHFANASALIVHTSYHQIVTNPNNIKLIAKFNLAKRMYHASWKESFTSLRKILIDSKLVINDQACHSDWFIINMGNRSKSSEFPVSQTNNWFIISLRKNGSTYYQL